MKSRTARSLRLAALLVLIGGLGTWFATGRHLGWTQTSVVTVQRDEITGIEYPVRQPGFVAGVEVPAAATAFALTLAVLGWSLQRRATVRV